jgi:phosphatidylethanolamine/phosphatidyl-N-methylethanolamine N-methyltransferase
MSAPSFLKQFLLHPVEIGAIAASSRGLADLMVDAAMVREAKSIVEFGPGTGVFTKRILEEMREDADFFAIELNQRFAEDLSKRYPGVALYHDSATHAKKYLDAHGHAHCDCIVCGLPWAVFGKDLQDQLIDTIVEILRPGGRLVTFAYLQGLLLPAGRAFRRKLQSRFRHVEKTQTVWWNLPPAFVYIAEK